MKVYIWYLGKYDDHHIEGIFASEAGARAAYDVYVERLRAETIKPVQANMAQSYAPDPFDVAVWEVKP